MRTIVRRSVTVSTLVILLVILGMLSGCGNTADYTDCFSLESISPGTELAETLIDVKYKVVNTTQTDGLTFCVTVNGSSEECTLNGGNEEIVTLSADIGRPEDFEDFNISCAVTYEVKKGTKAIWSQGDTITYDCSEMFTHPATLFYENRKVDIELRDYQSNFFDLSDLFEDFDPSIAHSVNFEGGSRSDSHASKDNNLVSIVASNTDDEGKASAASGSILKIYTYGTQKINDTYRFSDNLKVQIADAVKATDVKWDSYMSFSSDAKTQGSTVAGMNVTTFETNVLIENPSDETVYGTVTKFYVNDSAISDDYLIGSDHTAIESGTTGSLYNISSPDVWRTTGVSHVTKFGMKIKLETATGVVVYDGIQWLYLN